MADPEIPEPAAASSPSFFDDKQQTTMLALGLGALGGILLAVAIGIESVPVLVIGIAGLVASAAVWTIQGIREDK